MGENVYIISHRTKAIFANDNVYYRSKILEGTSKTYSPMSPEQIIAANCKINQTTMEGRIGEAKEILRTNSKVPIPVNPDYGLYLFPTASTRNKYCVWVSYYHIWFYEQQGNKIYLTFHDGTGIYVKTSKRIFDRQFKKASQVIAAFMRPKSFQGLLGIFK